LLIGYDPELSNQKMSLLLVTIMTLFYGVATVVSRYLKNLDVTLTNGFMGLLGFIVLFDYFNIF